MFYPLYFYITRIFSSLYSSLCPLAIRYHLSGSNFGYSVSGEYLQRFSLNGFKESTTMNLVELVLSCPCNYQRRKIISKYLLAKDDSRKLLYWQILSNSFAHFFMLLLTFCNPVCTVICEKSFVLVIWKCMSLD